MGYSQNPEDSGIDVMLNFKAMVECNEEYIVNYFLHGETNALAESINSKIQKFISSNHKLPDTINDYQSVIGF